MIGDLPGAVKRIRGALQQRVSGFQGPPLFDGQIPPRSWSLRNSAMRVSPDMALKHSAVWAALTQRADLMSSFPVDVFRDLALPDGTTQRVNMPTPVILTTPDGPNSDIASWIWATQFDLDRLGNAFGLITSRASNGLPNRIELQAAATATVIRRNGQLFYRFAGDHNEYPSDMVWHEKQYTVAGLDVGLSPTAYAAWSIGEHLSMQDFALQWFSNGGMPKARLKNTAKKLDPKEARIIKDRYRNSVNHGDIFVHGADWEYDMMQADAMGMNWIDNRRFSLEDIARFFGVPADIIEAKATTARSDIQYTNITQKHMTFLILKLGPAAQRREVALSRLLPQPRYVKLNTDAILRMDPMQRATYFQTMVNSRLMTNTEAREKDNRAPLTPAQIDELNTIYGPPQTQVQMAQLQAQQAAAEAAAASTNDGPADGANDSSYGN